MKKKRRADAPAGKGAYPHSVLWFCGLYAAGVAAVALVALLFKLLIAAAS